MSVLRYRAIRYVTNFTLIIGTISLCTVARGDEEAIAAPKPETHKLVMRYGALISSLPLTFFYGMKAWNWEKDHDFSSEPEGWFGQDTRFGGADKAGHIYGHYVLQRMLYAWFDYTEDGRNSKWFLSIATNSAIGFAVEIGDGWTAKYGFSWEDLGADAIGIVVAAMLDGFPLLDGLFGASVEYLPSRGYRANRKTLPLDFGIDYSGFKYMINFKPAGLEYLGVNVPRPLRYITFDVGYFTRGYCAHNDDEDYGYPQKTRTVFFGLSLNVAKMISDLYKNKNSIPHKLTVTPFEYVHLPLGYKHTVELPSSY